MKYVLFLLCAYFSIMQAMGDTPAPITSRSKTADGAGLPITSTTVGSKQALDVAIPAGISLSIPTSDPLPVQSIFGGSIVDPRARTWSLTTSDSVTAFQGGSPWSIGLPTGASTSALQNEANGLLDDIKGILGGYLPVVVQNWPSSTSVTVTNQPAGYALDATLQAISSKLKLGTQVSSNALAVVLASDQSPIPVTGAFTIGGSIAVSNFPSLQQVAVTNWPSPVTSVSVSNLPATQPVSGSVAISNYPATQAVTQGGAWTTSVTNFPTTQQVSVTSLPLPAGAATETTLASVNSKLQTTANGLKTEAVVTSLPSSAATAALQSAGNATLSSIEADTSSLDSKVTTTANGIKVDASIASLPLPVGAASEATVAALNAKLNSLGQKASNASAPVVLASDQSAIPVTNAALTSIDIKTPALGQALAAASVPVVLPAAQVTALTPPTSVGVNNFPATQAVSAASLPLPAGAATETTLSTLNTKVTTTANGIKVDGSATTQPVSAASLPLPSGASTSALQTTGNTSLASIDTKTPALGQALSAASVPVVLPAAQITALTPLSSISVSNFPATQAVSAATLPLPTGAATETTLAAVNTKLGGTLTTSVSNFPATQAVSAAALPLPTGAATETTLAAMSAKLPSLGQQTKANSQSVTLASDQGSIITATIESTRPTYSAAAAVTAAATATDICTITGSASKTIRVIGVAVDGTQTTASTVTASLVKRSTANTGGTSTTLTAAKHLSTDASATAVVRTYTANPTALGTSAGNIRTFRWFIPTATVYSPRNEWNLTTDGGESVNLIGTGETLAVNLNSTTVAGSNLSCRFTWIEE